MVVGGPAAERAGRHHAGLEEGPLLVRQQATDQCRSPRQRSAWNHVHARQGIPPPLTGLSTRPRQRSRTNGVFRLDCIPM
jgi:hypothetical protein